MEDSAPDLRAPRVRASPLVRRLAGERGLDLNAIEGSGPGGRIVERDIDLAHVSTASEQGSTDHASAARAARQEGDAGAQFRSAEQRHRDRAPYDDATGPWGEKDSGRSFEVITLRRRVTLFRLEIIREVLAESHHAIPLWAFAARAILRMGHDGLAVADGFDAPRMLDARAADPVSVLAHRLGAPGAAPCVLVDLEPEACSGGVVPLHSGTALQIVLGAPFDGASGREVEISLTARPQDYEPLELSAMLASLATSLESPGALLSNLPEV